MTDDRVTELTEGLGVKECPHCHTSEFWVHKDLSYKVNIETETIEEPTAHEHPEDFRITNLRCAKCGKLVTTEQDLAIFKTSLETVLKDELGRDPTETEFMDFWHYLDGDIPQWIRDNMKAWTRARVDEKALAEDNKRLMEERKKSEGTQ